MARPHIAALAGAAVVERLAEALTRALDEGEIHAATALAFAVGAAGGRIPPELALRLVPDLESIEHLPIIASLIDGDRVSALLDLVEKGRLSWEREGFALYLATQLLEGSEPPRRLVAMLRSLAREPIGSETQLLVGLAARALRDSELDSLTVDLVPVAAAAEREGLAQAVRHGFLKPVLEALPEEAPRVISHYTVVRSAPKVGRNDPCPCGSGRKYKKCCAGREETVAPPSRVEQFQKLASQGKKAQDRIFEELRPSELVRLDPATLT
ncbi:MAG TPA: SEC-C metal-binding domain-containing protein, partial [Thermoanaerobaculia bacterium]